MARGEARGPVKPVTEAEVREVCERLSRVYHPDKSALVADDPLRSLVRTILSQNTNDQNRDAALAELDRRFPNWDAVAEAPVEAIAEAIRASNHAYTKAARIREILRSLKAEHGCLTLDFLRDWPTDRIHEFLTSMHGVGRKSAACVLMFSLQRPVLPVDTHVHRVSERLGWIPPNATSETAHDLLQALVPPELVFPLHVGMWEHGRVTCRPVPRCARCPIYAFCIYPHKTAPHGLLEPDAASALPEEELAEESAALAGLGRASD
jgi:endonuclease-3